MNFTDQIFKSGDKVTRVVIGTNYNIKAKWGLFDPATDFGKTLCVSKCYYDRFYKLHCVEFVGLEYDDYNFFAFCFRKVEEIKMIKEYLNSMEMLNIINSRPTKEEIKAHIFEDKPLNEKWTKYIEKYKDK